MTTTTDGVPVDDTPEADVPHDVPADLIILHETIEWDEALAKVGKEPS